MTEMKPGVLAAITVVLGPVGVFFVSLPLGAAVLAAYILVAFVSPGFSVPLYVGANIVLAAAMGFWAWTAQVRKRKRMSSSAAASFDAGADEAAQQSADPQEQEKALDGR